ncbi:Mannosyl-oligosaccharide 1,2-alpha-mannosidase [Cyberlindnera fabianii]|uniref:alpha-1,2-Mannosidase n=1 Tax=Cyberlindnera fabianii TaxID=36022 RepID=A0A1V2L5W5_CYBFA|nr:Mannosyl-oligosaccharide 1,2-alpha-mannosidase [Cyberlindnera fabianii]
MSFYSKPGIGFAPKSNRENKYWRALKNVEIPGSSSRGSELPLYKDKPAGSSAYSTKKEALSFKRKQMAFKGVILVLAFYCCYYIGWFLKHEVGVSSVFEKEKDVVDWKYAQNEVKRVFKETWAHYEKDAWGKDVYQPLSQKGKNMGPQPLGWIIVDSLDTMLLMGLEEEFKTAESWVENELIYDIDYEVNVFETTIRMLGGLLSAFYLSKNDMFLDKAVDLADRLIGGFDSPSGLPYASVNLKTKKGVKSHADGGASSTAEVSTLQLEFKYLAKLTGEKLYWEKAEHIMKVLDDNHPRDGLAPIYVHPDTGKYQGKLIRLGSRGDSYYEYLLKQYLQTEEREPVYNTMYQESVRGMKDNLLRKSRPNGLAFLGELENGINGRFSNKMDHLVCFIGGLFALGATEGLTLEQARKSSQWNQLKEEDMMLAKDITHTCWQMYERTATGLSPEIVVFNTHDTSTEDFYIKPNDKHCLQRPETVESLFILYRITKDPIYRKWGWEIFKSFEKYTKTPQGSYTSLKDVTSIPPKMSDNMESFWLAETLKYLYLLFDDTNLMPLNEVVFNTEAHPFPVFSMNPLFSTGWKRSTPGEPGAGAAGVVEEPKKQNVRPPVDEAVDSGKEKKISAAAAPGTEKKLVDDTKKVKNAPAAAEPAKAAIDELKEIKEKSNEKELEVEDPANAKIRERLQNGDNVNEIIEDMIDM